MVATSSPPSSPPSSSIEHRARSSSFGTVTPTFSSDLAKLRAACYGVSSDAINGVNQQPVVHSYSEAIDIASTFDIFGTNSPLCQKLQLNNNKDKRTNNENGDDKKIIN